MAVTNKPLVQCLNALSKILGSMQIAAPLSEYCYAIKFNKNQYKRNFLANTFQINDFGSF